MLQDTVGVICVDHSGSVVSAVSSGGIVLKQPGRLGQVSSRRLTNMEVSQLNPWLQIPDEVAVFSCISIGFNYQCSQTFGVRFLESPVKINTIFRSEISPQKINVWVVKTSSCKNLKKKIHKNTNIYVF